MADSLFNEIYNPDVLSCLANLSNDEVFTPPEVANAMLDMLPQELFSNPDTTFLDPACKSGVFLREIAKRLISGLEVQIPDLQKRIDHIFHKQLFGIAITELTSLLSRRSVYCSKYPNTEYSVSRFPDVEGNIRYKRIKHTWQEEKCIYCGTSQVGSLSEEKRGTELETDAYEFIHTLNPEEILNMKFDVIISNPPYAQDTEGAGRQAKPIYNIFIDRAKKLKPRYITMIIPSRWFSGGMGLDKFRNEMMHDQHITKIVDFTNSKDCFHGISVSGGVCYFLWEKDKQSDCYFTNITNDFEDSMNRSLDEFPTLVRYNKAVSILHKIKSQNENCFDNIVSSLMPYGLSTNYRGDKERTSSDDLVLYSSNDKSYIRRSTITKGFDTVDKFKILISKTSAEHAGEPGKDGKFKVIPSSIKVLKPGEVCTHSYFTIGCYNEITEANNTLTYLKTKFVRFLMLLCISGFGLSKIVFPFVPMQDFSKPWTDEELYAKYNLNDEEIDFIESMIKPMELGGEDNG